MGCDGVAVVCSLIVHQSSALSNGSNVVKYELPEVLGSMNEVVDDNQCPQSNNIASIGEFDGQIVIHFIDLCHGTISHDTFQLN